MRTDRPDSEARHAAVTELLAWYVNGTLAAAERALVEEHLQGCAPCREQVDFWRGLAPAIGAIESIPVPHPARLRSLLARLDAAPGTCDAVEPGDAPRRIRAMRWLLVGQAAAIVALAGLLLVAVGRSPAATFHTLSASEPPAGAVRLRVVFDERASERELRGLLVPLGASFVGGPSPLGVYTLELAAGAELTATVAALREQPMIRFVEPVDRLGGQQP